VRDRYDDGGFSGGTLERPALQRLLRDVEQDRVDVVVVYKIDRLSRSLMDFSKLVEVFDAHNVTFVSITQSFNTTTSMGRLTLNILLSFAQFEREVIGERIRDKFAASRARGMWMGGKAPLGYDVRDRKLIINEGEAETVRRVFDLFLRTRSGTDTARQLQAEGRTSKTGRLLDKGTSTSCWQTAPMSARRRIREESIPGSISPSSRAPSGTGYMPSWPSTLSCGAMLIGTRRRRCSRGCCSAPMDGPSRPRTPVSADGCTGTTSARPR
jgi:DNA invertase Pin-like site-specific DNA recombinase